MTDVFYLGLFVGAGVIVVGIPVLIIQVGMLVREVRKIANHQTK